MQKLQIKKPTILVVPSFKQQKLIKEIQKNGLINIKVMTIDSFRKKFYFDYDDRSLYYLMTNYHYQYDVAKMYLKHLYEVDSLDFGSPKITQIKRIKEELIRQGLLFYDDLFRAHLKDKTVIFYVETSLDRLDQKMMEEVKKYSQVELYHESSLTVLPSCIWEFNTIEEEVNATATRICQLIEQGIEPSKIKICVGSSIYSNTIQRIFEWYHLPISIDNNYLFATKMGQDFLNHLTADAETSLKYLEDHYSLKNSKILEIYNQIVQILNQYIWAPSLLEVKDFIREAFKMTQIDSIHYEEEISMIHSLGEVGEDDYVFLLGFNQGEIPQTYKDEEYFNDELKKKLGLDTTNEKNKRLYESWLHGIRNTKNLVITTKKTSPLGDHYLSSLNDDLGLEVKPGKIDYQYSHLFNQLQLAAKIDTLVKYGEKSEDLELLYTTYPNISYGNYRSKYQQIPSSKIKQYLSHRLVLSYSAMNTYYQCGFRYYLSNILKLNIYEETFYTFLGNLFHYILSISLQEKTNIPEEYQKYIEKSTYPFNSREKFFLKHLESELEFIIRVIQEQDQTNSLKKIYLEEKITIPKDQQEMEVLFKGFVDKMYTNEQQSIVSIIDYKTGNPDLNLNHVIYGLDLQLPVYIYLARKKFPQAQIAGFYLQKILNNEISLDHKHSYDELKRDKLKLQGYSNADLSILEKFDAGYTESKVIKGMRTTSKGVASKKILKDEQIDSLENITETKINQAIEGILAAHFEINPKRVGMDNLGCKYCGFRDICFRTEEDIQNLKEYKHMEFLGGEEIDPKEA